MCSHCGWLDVAAAIAANLETRDRRQHTTYLLAELQAIVVANQHVTPQQRDAVESFAEQEGWAIA